MPFVIGGEWDFDWAGARHSTRQIRSEQAGDDIVFGVSDSRLNRRGIPRMTRKRKITTYLNI